MTLGWRGAILGVLRVLVGLGAASVGVIAATLLLVADTAGGRLMGAACLAGAGALLLAVAGGRRLRRPTAALAVAALGCLALAWQTSPSAADDAASGVSVYRSDARFPRAALSTLVPEGDQMILATWLLPAVDPWLDRRQAAALRQDVRRVYAALDADPAFAGTGSTLGAGYGQLFGLAPPMGHLYRYPPPGDAPRPVVLFLHGFGGNLKGYLWALRPLTDAGWTLVAPDFGLGLWAHPDGRRAIDDALRYIDERPDLDGSRIILAGLSNGGLGVTRHAAHLGPRLRGLIYYSAVVEPDAMPALAAALPGVPVALLHGARDRRIPLALIRDAHHQLRAAGVDAELTVVADADHFLLFSHPAQLTDFNQRALARATRFQPQRTTAPSPRHTR